jgi:hypothetical protein
VKFRLLTAILSLTLATSVAHAQIGLYGNFDTTRLVDNNFHTTTWFYGPGFGVYYDFLHLGPVSLGADLRGNVLWGKDQKYRSGLIGLRLAAKPPLLPIRPYLQGSLGVGGSNVSTVNGTYSQRFLYEILGGVDFTIFPHLDLRLAEIGYDRMSGLREGTVEPTDTLFTAATGVVFRFN